MKILMITPRFPPAIGGAEKHVFLLSKELTKRGNDVSVYTTTSLSVKDVYFINLVKNFKLKIKLSPLRDEIDNVKIKRFEIIFRLWSFIFAPALFFHIKKDIKKFDIIHAHGYHLITSVIGCYYAKNFNKPFMLTAHDLTIPNNLRLDAKLFKKLYDKTFGRYILKNSTRLIALTDDQICQYNLIIGNRNISRIKIIPNGIELEKYVYDRKYDIDIKDKLLLFVGRIEEYKGIQDVVSIMPEILKEIPNTKFIVVGKDYGYKDNLKKLIEELDIVENVIIIEDMSEDSLIELYKYADIFIFPSRMEGFGIVLLEAMALGSLCIAYSIPSIRKVIKNNENGILVNNKIELLDNVLYYLKNPDKKLEIERNALCHVRNYDIKNIVAKTEKIYMEIINENMLSG